MDANTRVETIVTHLDANDTWSAFQEYQALRGDFAGLDDAHKIMLADALLRSEWADTPPRPPAVPDPGQD